MKIPIKGKPVAMGDIPGKVQRALKRAKLSYTKKFWRLFHDYSPNSTAVFIFGVQRSGTTMVGGCLNNSPEVMNYSEDDPHAFEDYRLKRLGTIQSLVRGSPHKVNVFKPLTDSHRVGEIMGAFVNPKAIWMYRRYEDRVNSAIKRFGSHNLEVLTDISQGKNLHIWQAQGIEKKDLQFIKSFDYSMISPEEAAALFWYIRNRLFFNQRLFESKDIYMLSYENFVNDPERAMRKLCLFLDICYSPSLIKDIHNRSINRHKRPEVADVIHGICTETYTKLEQERRKKEAYLQI